MSSQDICAIIEACAKNNCTVIKFGDLHLQFGPAKETELQPPLAPPLSDTEISETHKKINEETLKSDSTELREEQIAMLQIEDPVEYERMIRDGELDDDIADESGE